MTQLIQQGKKTRYTREEKERALITLAYNNGNTAQTARDLEQDGFKLDPSTIYYWSRKSEIALYKEIQEECLPAIRQRAAERHMEAAEASMDASAEVLQRLRGQINEIPARDLPGALRNIDTSTGIHRDKARELRGEANLITTTDKRDLKQVLRALKGKGLGANVEVIDAQVVEEKPAELESANA